MVWTTCVPSPAGRMPAPTAAAVPLEATQAPVTTVAPAGTPVLATQVADA